jgi:hypothetical protein
MTINYEVLCRIARVLAGTLNFIFLNFFTAHMGHFEALRPSNCIFKNRVLGECSKNIGYLVADPSRLFALISKRVPASLLISGLFGLRPDRGLSAVLVSYDSTGMAIIERAEVVCLSISSKAWTPLLSLNGIGIELGEIVFILENTLLTSQSITMYGTATLKAVTESIQLTLSCDLNTKGPIEVAFAVSSTESLQSLSGALGFEAIMSSTMPFSGSPLSSLSKTSELVVVFTNFPNRRTTTLSRISATTSSDDWKSFLLSSFPLKKLVPTTNLEVSLDVLYPLLPKQRTVGVSVALGL